MLTVIIYLTLVVGVVTIGSLIYLWLEKKLKIANKRFEATLYFLVSLIALLLLIIFENEYFRIMKILIISGLIIGLKILIFPEKKKEV